MILSILFVCFLNVHAQTKDFSKEFLQEKVNIAGVTQGTINKETMLKSKGLALDEKASALYHITSFRMTLVVEGKKPKDFKSNKSGELTKSMMEAISAAPKGSKVYFEYIKCVDNKNQTHSLYAANFVLN